MHFCYIVGDILLYNSMTKTMCTKFQLKIIITPNEIQLKMLVLINV